MYFNCWYSIRDFILCSTTLVNDLAIIVIKLITFWYSNFVWRALIASVSVRFWSFIWLKNDFETDCISSGEKCRSLFPFYKLTSYFTLAFVNSTKISSGDKSSRSQQLKPPSGSQKYNLYRQICTDWAANEPHWHCRYNFPNNFAISCRRSMVILLNKVLKLPMYE